MIGLRRWIQRVSEDIRTSRRSQDREQNKVRSVQESLEHGTVGHHLQGHRCVRACIGLLCVATPTSYNGRLKNMVVLEGRQNNHIEECRICFDDIDARPRRLH